MVGAQTRRVRNQQSCIPCGASSFISRGWGCRGGSTASLRKRYTQKPRLGLVKHRTWPHRILPPGREITFKTDPEKGDYELETGASRNFESWTDKQATEKEHKEARYGVISPF